MLKFFGDSVAKLLAGHYQEAIAKHGDGSHEGHTRNGASSEDLLRYVKRAAVKTKTAVKATTCVVHTGTNDFLASATKQNVSEIVTMLGELYDEVLLCIPTTAENSTPFLLQHIEALGRILQEVKEDHPSVHLVPLQSFATGYQNQHPQPEILDAMCQHLIQLSGGAAPPPVGTELMAEDRGHWYKARVLATRAGHVKVHWHGFKKSTDRWVGMDRIRSAPVKRKGGVQEVRISGSSFAKVNGRYVQVDALPKGAIQKPTKGYPIWKHATHKDVHILRIQSMWWISHYQPSDRGGKDYYVSKPRAFEAWDWTKANGKGKDTLRVKVV